MRDRIVACLCVAFAPTAFAAEEAARLPLSGYAAPAMAPVAAKSVQPWEAPALRSAGAEGPRKSARGCEGSGLELCIGADGRLTVPGARKFLPEIPGLTPERLSVKRSGIVVGYSF